MTQVTSKVYFRSLNLVYYALLMGQIILVIVFFVVKQVEPEGPDYSYLGATLMYLVPLVAVAGLIVSMGIYAMYTKKLRQKSDLIEKMTGYRSTMIIRLAILEIPTAFAAVAYYMTKGILFLGIAGFILLVLLLLRPDKYKIANNLRLSSTEIARLEDPNEFIAEAGSQG